MIKDGLSGKEKDLCSFLLIGQSNMAGRGNIGDVPPIDNPLCHMLRMGRWQKMSEPINPDRGIFTGEFKSGVNLGASFADDFAKATGKTVGLIPCADGGTRIAQWLPGEALFDHAVAMTKLAMRTSRLCGILWHQGESDCLEDEDVAAYRERFLLMIGALREALGVRDVPVVIGEISENISEAWKVEGRPMVFNRILRDLAREVPRCALVSSAGLRLKADGIHFDAPSLRILGSRYYNAYATLEEDERA